ncbi:MAG: redox-sensing transcriptional repressor Rex [Clostridia bacterium]
MIQLQSQDKPITISKQALQRMPYYIQHLRTMHKNGIAIIAAPALAAALGLNEVQVRKDLAAISTTKGKPKTGFNVDELIANMEEFLGYNNIDEAILVGVGSLGRALMCYKGIAECGMNIVAAFDINEGLVGSQICGKYVFHMDELIEICKRLNVRIGIITVPADQAQGVCDKMVESGILAIWNFAPSHLRTPENILVQNENMAASLAMLSKHLGEKLTR